MPVKFSDIEFGFFFVSSAQMSMNSAYLNCETGEIYYISEMGDSDELPEDIYEDEKYVAIPHKNELDLGKELVLDFTADHLPDELEDVYDIFRGKGAYSRFKNLLEKKGLLEEWFAYEQKRQEEALREWCEEIKIVLE